MTKKQSPIVVGLALILLTTGVMAQKYREGSTSRWQTMIDRFDTDKNGLVSKDEFRGSDSRFDEMDKNRDGQLDGADAKDRAKRSPNNTGGNGGQDGLTQRHGADHSPDVGEIAPDFTLKMLNSKKTVTLSDVYHDKPVILTLGSYTCPPFREAIEGIEQIYQQYKDKFHFCFVYIKEAHATDERPAPVNEMKDINFTQPTTYKERTDIATTCQRQVDLSMPILVDTLDNAVEKLYAGAPNRTYLIGQNGTVLYKGVRGPQGTNSDEIIQAINSLLNPEKLEPPKKQSGLKVPEAVSNRILFNGKILTADKNFSIAQAVAIQGDRIVAVGTDTEIMQLKDADTVITDLEGRTVIPGLIDNHVHYLRSSPYWKYEALFDGVNTRQKAVELLKEKIASSAQGEWVLSIGGWNKRQFIDSQASFTRQELDELAPNNPVFIQQGFSGGVANSAALDLVGRDAAGVTADTGFISSAPDGRFAGVPNVLRLALPSYDEEQWKTQYLAQMNMDYNKGGITTVWNAGAIHYDNQFTEWSKSYVEDNGNWSGVRMFHHIKSEAKNPASAEEMVQSIQDWKALEKGDYFRMQGLGEIPYIHTYDLPTKGWNPKANALEIYQTVMAAAAAKGWTVSEHAMLEEKFDDIFPLLREIDQKQDIAPLRWAFHHCYGMTKAQIGQAAELGMFLALQNSPAMPGGAMGRRFGQDSPPFRTAQESGIMWGLGSDAKIVSPYPAFFTLYFAVTGKNIHGDVILQNETVTREQALIAHTRSNAWYLFMEDLLGSIEPGKYADLVVLDNDYMTIPADQIKDLQSVLTLTGGRAGYDAGILKHTSSTGSEITFFGWSDTHIPADGNIQRIEPTIIAMNQLPGTAFPAGMEGFVKTPSFVFNCGDITVNGAQASMDSYEKLIDQQLKYPSYEIGGNHDQVTDIVSDWIIGKHGAESYSFNNGGIYFIAVSAPFTIGAGHKQPIPQSALDEISARIAAIPDGAPIVVATHLSHQMATNLDEVIGAFGDANVVLWMGGHGHQSSTRVYKGIHCVQLPSPASRDAEFMVIRITPDQLTINTRDYRKNAWATDASRKLDIALSAYK
ncbi:amidohydrolase family protein [Pontiella sulfatireligans]|uniref:N-substituted formamide deformylase n=1 Tax=Pontiella sulfatireligans TaxID=2750658 RepID=A0A6C2UHZ3_9BACT|nr:amidohydrolase family protein [Pontiella sulfatireligans]VGO19077.1 N-substituted formamide deformylase [Pontiella sulfatireligans]